MFENTDRKAKWAKWERVRDRQAADDGMWADDVDNDSDIEGNYSLSSSSDTEVAYRKKKKK